MKHLKFKLLILGLILIASPKISAYDFEVDGMYFTITSMSDLECELDSVSFKLESLSLKSTVQYRDRTLNVTALNHNAFKNAINIRHVEIDGVKTLPPYLFSKSSIEDVSLSGVEELGEGLFAGCIKLSRLQLSGEIKHIPKMMCQNCKNLNFVEFPNSVSYLDDYCFDGCEVLSKFSIIKSHLHIIGEGALRNNLVDLDNFIIEDSAEPLLLYSWDTNNIYPHEAYIGRNLMSELPNEILNLGRDVKSINFSDEVTYLPNGFFANNEIIERVTLPNLINNVPYRCFYNCI